jgi:cobalt-precorrin-5B (C1)-methyltransferase
MGEGGLKNGFTTGTAAAASVKGALILLLSGSGPGHVEIPFLTEGGVTIPLHKIKALSGNSALCSVIKDGGDDPDITHKAEIGAIVTLTEAAQGEDSIQIRIRGGKGVGVVTRKGLEIPPGEPAINRGPRKMIEAAVQEVFRRFNRTRGEVLVEVFVPQGESLAEKTLNKRLGILGGISILGTTGIVRAMSHEAYVSTIEASLKVLRASGSDQAVFTTGRRSERFSQAYLEGLEDAAFIQIGDFFKASLDLAGSLSFTSVILSVFFGKAVKMAMGYPHTHAAKSELCLNALSRWVLLEACDQALAEEVSASNTAREAFLILQERCPKIFSSVGRKMILEAKRFLSAPMGVRSIIFDYEGVPVYDSLKEGREAS